MNSEAYSLNSEAYSGEGCEVSASSPWTSKIYDFKWVLCPYGCWALSKYKFGLSWCLGVCLFVCNKRLNGYTDWAQIFFCGISHDPREGLCMIKISKISLQQNSILMKPGFFAHKICEFLFVFVLQYKEKISQLK